MDDPLAPAAHRLLLLEPCASHQALLADVLTAAGYQVETAEEGWAGLQLARQQVPSLVVCATRLPGLDGYALLQLHRQSPALQAVPFILTGPDASWLAMRQAMEQGADDYLALPCDASVLLRAVAARLLRPGPAVVAAAAAAAPPPAALTELVTGYPQRQVSRRQVVYTEGEEVKGLYYVQAGRVKTTKTTSFGKELIIGIHAAGEFFGYKDLLEQRPHHEAAFALENTVLHCLPPASFWPLLGQPAICLELLRELAGRKRAREEMLLDLAYHSLRRRLANALLLLHEQAENRNERPAYIQLTREDLAALVGTTPESASRTLSEFRHDQLLELTPRGIRLLQPDQLRQAEW